MRGIGFHWFLADKQHAPYTDHSPHLAKLLNFKAQSSQMSYHRLQDSVSESPNLCGDPEAECGQVTRAAFRQVSAQQSGAARDSSTELSPRPFPTEPVASYHGSDGSVSTAGATVN